MNKAMKYAKKQLTRLGCVVEKERPDRIEFRMRNGSVWTCNNRVPLDHVRQVVAVQRGVARVVLGSKIAALEEVFSAPRLEAGEYEPSKHFLEMFQWMRGQGLRSSEVTAAVLAPESVRVADGNADWLYCHGRIAVAVGKPEGNTYPLVTVLWATDELWEQNPRPEKEMV